ncbi:MAG: PKD domain-containing protein, partial [Dinghuibacter sp.]|nr:PKD domain-containing protein [Dinghuibacter sp.]
MMRFVKLLICSLLFAAGANAQDISNKGKEFWVGYGHHQFMENLSNTQEMVIYLSAERPATVKVSIDSSLGNWSQTVNIPANTVVSVGPMPKSGPNDCRLYDVPITFGGIGGEGVFRRKGIHIEADTPIVAYAHIYGSASSGASMLTPIESWGHNYITINSDQVYANNCFSWFYVIASKDSTYVEITPSVPSVLGRPANIPFTVMLMKGQIYQYTAAIISGSNGYNATGSKIRSVANASGNCFPVAVFAGSSRTTNPAACGSGGGDNDNQQCFPTQAWGKRYLTAPTSSSTGAATFQTNNYRVLVKDPTTIVKRNGVQIPLASIINNSYYKFESNAGELIEADKPIMVAQHMTGGGCSNGGLGDPEMIYISSMEQAINRIGFYRNTRENITVNYLTMIVPAGAANSVRIDGSATVDHSYVHPRDPNYRVLVKRWSAAQAQAIVTCDSGFTAITYGLGSVESYGYNAGTFLKNLNVVGSIRNPADSNSAVAEHQFTCKLTPVKISAFIRYKPTKLVWRISQVGPQISPNTDVTDNAPVPIDSSLIFGVKYYKYTLPGNYTFSDTGTFTVPLLSSHPTIENCYLTENISFPIVVKARPNPNFTFAPTTAICELDTIQFTGQPATLNGYTVQQYRWTFPGPALDSGQIVKRLLPAGVNNVNLRVVTTDGCVADTTKQVTTYAKPVADFSIAPASICQNGLTTFTDNSSYGVPGAFTSWYWDFGNGTTVTLPNGNPQTASYPSYGNIAVKHVVKVSNTCISDTVTKILPVWAKPIANFTFPTGCLPTNGQITFTNTTTVPDLQAWTCVFDLGDGNTSNTPNPTHVYTSEGTYTVRLIVTTANGCSDTISKSVQIKITPALSFPVLNAVCESSAPVSVALATVTNGIAGTGVYSGPGTNAAGMFNPAAAGFGVHTIK